MDECLSQRLNRRPVSLCVITSLHWSLELSGGAVDQRIRMMHRSTTVFETQTFPLDVFLYQFVCTVLSRYAIAQMRSSILRLYSQPVRNGCEKGGMVPVPGVQEGPASLFSLPGCLFISWALAPLSYYMCVIVWSRVAAEFLSVETNFRASGTGITTSAPDHDIVDEGQEPNLGLCPVSSSYK